MKKYRNLIIGIILGAILLFAWFKLVNVSEVISYFRVIDWWLLVAASALYVFAYFLRSLRWRSLVGPLTKLSIRDAFSLSMAGLLMNYVVSFRAGDITQSIMLSQLKNVPVSSSLSTIFIDRLVNLSPIILVLILIPLVSFQLSTTLLVCLIVLLAIFAALVSLVMLSLRSKQKVVSLVQRFLVLAPRRFRDRILAFVDGFLEGMWVVRGNRRRLFWITALTILAVLFDGVYFYVLFIAFGPYLGFLPILFGYSLINLTYILPMPPAQIGSNEVLMLLVFSFGLGVDTNLAGAVMVCGHVLTGFLIFLIGLASFSSLGVSMRKAPSRKENEKSSAVSKDPQDN